MRKAFTLTEVVSVIAIIAILAAVLLPVFVQAKEGSTTPSLSRSKQIDVADSLYEEDYDSPTPLAEGARLARESVPFAAVSYFETARVDLKGPTARSPLVTTNDCFIESVYPPYTYTLSTRIFTAGSCEEGGTAEGEVYCTGSWQENGVGVWIPSSGNLCGKYDAATEVLTTQPYAIVGTVTPPNGPGWFYVNAGAYGG